MRAGLIAIAVVVAIAFGLWLWLREAPLPLPKQQPDQPDQPLATGQPPNANGPVAAIADAGAEPGPLPTLRGDVRDDTGGVAQALVEVHLRNETKDTDCTSNAQTSTVSGGSFELGPLCAGQYDARATRGSAVATATVRLARGADPERLYLQLREGTRLTLHVTDGKKQPLPQVDVSVQDSVNGYLAKAQTDDKGVAVIEGLVPRAHSVWARKSEYLEATLNDRTLAAGDDSIDLQLIAGVRLEGRVIDPDGAGIDDKTYVRLANPRKELHGGYDTVESSGTFDGGEFSVGPVRPGAYTVVAEHDGFPDVTQTVRVPGPRVTLKLGRGTTVEGMFLDADGAPIFDGDVNADSDGESSRSARSDDLGHFALDGLGKGSWTLMAIAKSEDGGAQGISILPLTVRQEPKVQVTLQLKRGLRIDGRCVNDDGSPADTEVIAAEQAVFRRLRLSGFDASRVPGGSVAISSCKDRFTVEGLEAGRYALLACSNEDAPTFANAGDRDVVVKCHEGTLKFRVVDGQGRPITKYALGGGTSPPDDWPEGRYQRPMFGDRDDVLTIRAPGYATLQRPLRAKKGESVDLGDLTLVTARKLDGRVVDARDGKPVSGADVRFGVDHEDAVGRTRTRSDGAFELTEVAREDGQLFVTHPSYKRQVENVSASQAQLEVRLSAGLELAGAVITHDGREVLGVEVEARGPDGSMRKASVASGRYSIGSLEPGDWKLRLTGPEVSAFDPQTVTLLGAGSVTADFVERLAGVNVTVMPLDDEGHPVIALTWLVPGRHARPATDAEAWKLATGSGLASEGDASGAQTFNSVAPGVYTAVIHVKDFPGMVWVESFEVSSSMPSMLRIAMPRGLTPLPP